MNAATHRFAEIEYPVKFTTSDIERFWSFVDKSGPIPAHRPELGKCWMWTAYVCPTVNRQYGVFHFRKTNKRAHRVSYFINTGQDPRESHVLHHCDNSACVNPKHLWLGSDADNMRDKALKGRQSCGEKANCGKLTNESVIKMREMRELGETYEALARMFNVAYRTARDACLRISWKHI